MLIEVLNNQYYFNVYSSFGLPENYFSMRHLKKKILTIKKILLTEKKNLL